MRQQEESSSCPRSRQLELRDGRGDCLLVMEDSERFHKRRRRRKEEEMRPEEAPSKNNLKQTNFNRFLPQMQKPSLLLLLVLISLTQVSLGSQDEQQKSSQQLLSELSPSSNPIDKPQAEALKALKGSSGGQQQTGSGSSTAPAGSNVIIIKYANVTKSEQDQSANSLNLLKLYEPLSVSVIESRFAHSIQLFDVSQNQLSTLSNNLFCPLSNEVRLLNVSHNLLENFDSLGLISQTGQLCLNELRILDMSFNLIKHLPATGVASLHNLEILNLSNNLIETLDELSLSSLFRLIKLDLSNNRIQSLPLVLFQKSYSMQILKLQSNQLQITISRTFLAGLISLEELNLSQNNISQITDFAFLDKINLTRVDLTYNKLTSLRQEALRVNTSLNNSLNSINKLATASGGQVRQRLHHNGQFATPRLSSTTTTGQTEFLISANPFVCDCQLEWLRNFQQPAIKTTSVLNQRQDPYQAQLLQLTGSYQSDQASSNSVMMQAPSSSLESPNNISEILTGSSHAPEGPATGSRFLQSSNQQQLYGRIGDWDQIKCSPLFRRNSQRNPRHKTPSDGASHHHHHHHNHHLQSTSTSINRQPETMIDLAQADSSNFLCRYKSHCFALCHCCEFDACDCEMICPNGCNCYYDSTWRTNIIDCSSNNHSVVPDRIPMDVTGLYLDGNQIDSLKPSNLIARKSLKSLYLNSSNLQFIANRTFNGLIELQSLYLNDNMLRSLQGHEFEPLSQLKALYLQSNHLDFISNQTFIYLRSLEILDLSNNRLTSQNLDLFWSIGHHNIRLKQLNIAHNWWSCQCNSINRFRQILKHKFLLSGSVNIADKNQLRCYYNSTTIGPLILQDSSSNQFQQQLPATIGNQRQLFGSSNQLTEINQCSEFLDDNQKYPQDINPPLIQSNQPELDLEQQPDLRQPIDVNSDPSTGFWPSSNPIDNQRGPPATYNPFNNPSQQAPISDQPVELFVTPSQNLPGRYNLNNNQTIPNSMPLTSFLLLCILCLIILIIAASIFVFVRQQQQTFQQNHNKKKSSSAASTSSASSSSASSTAISSLNGKRIHHHHHHHQQASGSQQLQYAPASHLHHQLVMSNGSQGATTTSISHQQQASNSSQSNIYAALVSPTTATTLNNNNLYSNSSTTASHHSNSPSQVQQQQQNSNQTGSGWPVYNQAGGYAGAPYEGHYTLKSSAYKTGSLYQQPETNHHYNLEEQQAALNQLNGGATGDWMKLPKVKQFVSKLVNKSLAKYRACSRDELSTITSDKIYDAFISYDKRDEPFVMQHLSAELEYGQPQYSIKEYRTNKLTNPTIQNRIADRFRDLPLPTSAYIAEAITSVISCSHRTIVVLTENYLTSDWCRYELQAALQEASIDKSHKIIAVLLDPKCLLDLDPEMRALLTNCQVYQPAGGNQLVQLADGTAGGFLEAQQLVASLNNPSNNQVVVSTTQTAQLATSKITFINYNERKFWQKIKQLMPLPRPSTQTLTLTTKN